MVVRRPKQSKLIARPGPEGKDIEMTGQRPVNREDFRSWHFRQLRSHHRVPMLTQPTS